MFVTPCLLQTTFTQKQWEGVTYMNALAIAETYVDHSSFNAHLNTSVDIY